MILEQIVCGIGFIKLGYIYLKEKEAPGIAILDHGLAPRISNFRSPDRG